MTEINRKSHAIVYYVTCLQYFKQLSARLMGYYLDFFESIQISSDVNLIVNLGVNCSIYTTLLHFLEFV